MNELTSKMYFRTLSVVHLALTLSLVLTSAVAYFKNYIKPIPHDEQLAGFLINIVPLAALSCIIAAFIVYNNKMAEIRDLQNLHDKLVEYRSAHIIRMAVLEFPGLLSIISYMITGNERFLLVAVLVVVIFLLIWPGVKKAVADMRLDQTDTTILQDPKAVVLKHA